MSCQTASPAFSVCSMLERYEKNHPTLSTPRFGGSQEQTVSCIHLPITTEETFEQLRRTALVNSTSMQVVSKTQLKTIEPLMTVKALGTYLGISPSAVYRMVERRDIPFYRLRSGLRFSKSDVERYLKSCQIEATFDYQSTYGSTNH